MYYPSDEWIPLRDAVSTLELELAPLIRAGLDSEAKGSGMEIERQIWAAAWSVCDSCLTAILTSQGSTVLLSKSLFTREKNDSPYGDFLKLDIGQLGSQDWPQWAGLGEPNRYDDRLSEEELKRLLHPFYSHHVLISAKDFEAELASQKSRIVAKQGVAEPSAAQVLDGQDPATKKKSRGRPPLIPDALEVYRSLYPNGHKGQTIGKVIDEIHANGGPNLSCRSFGRMFDQPAASDEDGQK